MQLWLLNERNKKFVSIVLLIAICFSFCLATAVESYAIVAAPVVYSGAALIAGLLIAWGCTDSSALYEAANTLYENAGTTIKSLILGIAATGVSCKNGMGKIDMSASDYSTIANYISSKVSLKYALNRNAGVFAPIVIEQNPITLTQLEIAMNELPTSTYPARIIIYTPIVDKIHVIGLKESFLASLESPYYLPIVSNIYGCSMRIKYTGNAKSIVFKGKSTEFISDLGPGSFDFIKRVSLGGKQYYRQEAFIVTMSGSLSGAIASENLQLNNAGFAGCYIPKGTILNKNLTCSVEPSEEFSGYNTGAMANYYVSTTSIKAKEDGSVSVAIPYTSNPSFDGEDTNIDVPEGNSVDDPITLETVIQGYESIDGFFEAGGSIILADGTIITKADNLVQTGSTEGATSGTQANTGDVSIPADGTWPYTIPILGDILTILERILEAIREFFDVSDFSLNFDALKIGLTNKFPFCIPFDLLRVVKSFSAEPMDFVFRINFKTAFFEIDHTVDLSPFKVPIKFFRWVCIIYFTWILISRTKDMMKW